MIVNDMKMLPENFIKRYEKIYGILPDSVSLGEEIVSFRVNTLIASEDEAMKELKKYEFEVEKISYIENAYVLLNKNKRELSESRCFNAGLIYIQSLSSMLPVKLLTEGIEDFSSINGLDMCAAPGSKTSQLAAVMHNQGKITAVDSSRNRYFTLKRVLNSFGVENTEVVLGHSEHLWRKYGPVFDLVLVDAPCSGEGRFDFKKEEEKNDWSIEKIKRLSILQKQILFSGVMCLKSGGRLVYSTCTIAPEENEEVVDSILKKFERALSIEDYKMINNENFKNGLTEWEGKRYDDSVKNAVRIMPDKRYEGFFICKFVRN